MRFVEYIVRFLFFFVTGDGDIDRSEILHVLHVSDVVSPLLGMVSQKGCPKSQIVG